MKYIIHTFSKISITLIVQILKVYQQCSQVRTRLLSSPDHLLIIIIIQPYQTNPLTHKLQHIMQSHSILSQLLNPQSQHTLTQLQNKYKAIKPGFPTNLLNHLLPRSTLAAVNQFKQYTPVQQTPAFSIYKKAKCAYKLVLKPKPTFNKQILISVVLNEQKYTKWHPNITQIEAKHSFPSENFKVIYQKNKSYGTFWKSRDFVYVRHVVKFNGDVYVIDKSIDHQSYPPYVTTTRGEYFAVWGLFLGREEPEIVINLMMRNEGMLNDDQQTQLQNAYIKEFKGLCPFAEKLDKPLPINYSLEWDISESESARELDEIDYDEEDVDGNIDTRSEEDDICDTQYQFNEKNEIIVPSDYIKAVTQQTPLPPKQPTYFTSKKGHFIWKDQWRRDESKGGMIFTDQLRIKRSRNVLKYMMKKMGKNFLTGKSILNVSLPVNIFSRTSNLEHLATGFTYAPLFLQKAVGVKSPAEQIRLVALFAITNPIAFITMQKPFNPILGETFQGWINGCPIYLEQTSHHPPIASVYFIGRGYKISASLESKAEISMNSGVGSTDGVFKIVFDDGTDYNFRSPAGQISGTLMGDRKFNFIGKSWLWSKRNKLFLQLTYDPDKKGFLSLSKKETTSDYFVGDVVTMSQNFISNIGKKSGKGEAQYLSSYAKHVTSKVCKVDGTWPVEIRIDEKRVFSLAADLPHKLEVEKHLLPSDCSWREDVAFRKRRDYTKAQEYKQVLENKQRHDAKLRKEREK